MTNELQIFCSLPKCEKDADTECIDCEYMVREEPKKRMTNEEAKAVLQEQIDKYGQEYDAEGIEALETAIKALEQTEWIPVSERLPEEGGAYLVTTKWKGSYSGDVYIETNMAVYRKQRKEWDCVDVIAWVPLPEPYKEK